MNYSLNFTMILKFEPLLNVRQTLISRIEIKILIV